MHKDFINQLFYTFDSYHDKLKCLKKYSKDMKLQWKLKKKQLHEKKNSNHNDLEFYENLHKNKIPILLIIKQTHKTSITFIMI